MRVRRLAAAAALLGLLTVPGTAAQAEEAGGPVAVHVDVHVLSVGNYDANRGTYTLDFYLRLSWDAASAPPRFEPRLEFMNGRAASRDVISDDTVHGERVVWYRFQANLFAQPFFRDYPFDHQHIELILEDAVHPVEQLVFVPSLDGDGLDDQLRVGGWRIDRTTAAVEAKEYPFGETYSRFVYRIEVERPTLGVGLRSFLPPLAFCFVAGIAFFLHPSKVANRITLGTGMVISAVAFHVSQTVALPSLPRLTLFDSAMIATYTFIASSLAVTTLIMIDEDYWKESDHTRQINIWGAAVTLTLPILVFGLLRAI